VCTRFCFSESLWWVWGLMLNVILPPYHLAGAFLCPWMWVFVFMCVCVGVCVCVIVRTFFGIVFLRACNDEN